MPTRLGLACNQCRTKKQKCSGTWPSCLQCDKSEIECTYAERKQRGPSKGYIEGLEARLRETEQVLLQLLPVVTDEQLIAATEDIDPKGLDDGRVIKGSTKWAAAPPDLKNNVSLEYWERHPMGNLEEIRAWQRSCVLAHNLTVVSAASNSLVKQQASRSNGGQSAARHFNTRRSISCSEHRRVAHRPTYKRILETDADLVLRPSKQPTSGRRFHKPAVVLECDNVGHGRTSARRHHELAILVAPRWKPSNSISGNTQTCRPRWESALVASRDK